MKFTILVNPSLDIITIHFVCLNHASENREEDFFNKYINFTLFTPKLHPLLVGGNYLMHIILHDERNEHCTVYDFRSA